MGLWQKALNMIGLGGRRNEGGGIDFANIPGAFRGTSGGTFWDWIVSPTTIDYQLRTNIYRLRIAARDMALNNPVVRQYLELLAQNVIGAQGMKIQGMVRDNSGKLNAVINEKIEDAWCEFWKSPFVDGKLSGIHGERVLLKAVSRDGEIFVRMITDRGLGNKWAFGLQVIDPDQVDHTFNRAASGTENEVRLGIEVDQWGRAVGIWIWDNVAQDVNPGMDRTRTRIPASEILHIYDPERANASRGVTWLNSVMQQLRHLDGYAEAAVVAARTAACAFPIFEQAEGLEADPGVTNFQLDLNPGTGMSLPAGLKVSNWNPNQPNTGYSDFIKSALRFFASGMHVSYNALSSDLENVNYSSIRAGILIERDHYRVLQRWWMDAFRQPIYEAWLRAALLNGALTLDSRDPRKFCSVRWIPRGWQWVDPLKDVNAAVIAVQNGFDSRSRIIAERGDEFEDILEELSDERDQAESAGLDFSGAPITAKDVASLTKDEEAQTEEEKTADQKKAANLIKMHREAA